MPYSCLFEKDIIAYGTGAVSRYAINYLAAERNCRLLGATNSRVSAEGRYRDTDLPVRSISEWARLKPDATVLITTVSQHHETIMKLCKAAGYQDVIPMTTEMFHHAVEKVTASYLKSHGTDFCKDQFSLGNMSFLNPYRFQNCNVGDFFFEFGELIFPYAFQDMGFVSDGLYVREQSELKQGDIVFDLGASVGLFSVYAASKGCISYAFEPTASLIPVLNRHSELNHNLIIPVEAAVAHENKTVMFHVSNFSSTENTLVSERVSNSTSVPVSQVTIDDFVAKHGIQRVDFIKADIEGAERLMLIGAQNTLAKYAPRLSICTYHLPDDKEVLTELIKKANPRYKIEYQWKKLYAYV